ncbi:unnamed protein product [Closterium sp. Naga37s-1]|nr:unnamed protein product [Closterium sp. Naga37s-1]
MESLPADVVYTVLRLAQPAGLQIARLACVSTGFARMAKEHLWRWHCRDQLAVDASPSDAQRSDSKAVADANAVRDAPAAITASGEDPEYRRERLERMLHDMGSEEVLTLAKLVNLCPGVRPALLRGREYKAMICGCGSSLQCACWQPFASVEGHPSSAPHFRPGKFEIMDIVRAGVPAVHFLISSCFVHLREEHDAVPFLLIRGLDMDFQSSKMYESQTPFVCDEHCPYCSSQGHLYGLRRLGEAMRASSSMAEVEVERVEGHDGSQSSQGSEDNEEGEREASDEAYYAMLGRVLQRVVRGGLEEGEYDVSIEEGETDDDVSTEEGETDDDVEPGTPTSGAQAVALTVPAGPAATPELARAHMVEAAASAAAAPAHAPNAAPVDVTVPSATSGAASAAASDSASLLPTAAAIPHRQLLEAPQL